MAVESRPLFHPEVIRQHLRSFALPEHIQSQQPTLNHWAELISSGRADKFKETDLLPDFITDFFCKLLGYTRPAGPSDSYTLSRETHVEVDGQFADAVLGRFRSEEKQFIVALEGKGTRDPLDRPFAGRRMSAVDQGYRYAINLQCDWVIITSMRETRLYHKGSNQLSFERFETVRLARDPSLLKRFVFLLGADRVVPATGQSHLYSLLKASESVGRELTDQFYSLYADIRQKALVRLCHENSAIPPQEILRCTQKLLDRVLFCAFCEDRGLLPADTLHNAFSHRDPYNPKPIWDNFRGLFRSIDQGNAGLNIPAYNGGLFAADPVLDCLNVPDEVCTHFKDLGGYNYRPAQELIDEDENTDVRSLIDVDILGHIFEQSITDLERLRHTLESGEPIADDRAKARRKKEGAFYTPAFITRYIVEQALGGVLKVRFENLRQKHEAEATGTSRKPLADPSAYDLHSLNAPQRKTLTRFWEAWQEELMKLRILDPACGSGAFLIEAFDQLYAVYETSNQRLEELRGQRTLFDLDRQILQHNLYGVDLNPEAIQICQLSLWIKTAARGKVLTSLDHSIREGNSVISDPAVHPKAFHWQTAFPEVFAQGGFDVVVGNPPYIRQEWLAPFKPFWEGRFNSYTSGADIFVYFFELGTELLRPGGRLAFITSGSWVRGTFGAPLRKFLSSNIRMESLVDFGEFQPFEDAEMIRPSITIFSKQMPSGEMRLFRWLTSGHPPKTLSDEIATAPLVSCERFGEEPWDLEPNTVIALRDKMAGNRQNLADYTENRFFYGIKTGLNDLFVIDRSTRDRIVQQHPASAEVLKPFVQGTHLRPYYIEDSDSFLIALKSSDDFSWPWSERGSDAEKIFADVFPPIFEHLNCQKEVVSKRSDQGRFWWELRSCAYWDVFEQTKIVWPDISKLPRFSMDTEKRYLGNTGYVIPGGDYYLLGILSSWAAWFFISKTAQPLRLRGDRWQYRLIAQFMEQVPIPDASKADRDAIAAISLDCNSTALERYKVQTSFQRRLLQSFSESGTGRLIQKAEAWWELSLNDLGAALKQSFKLAKNPMKNPETADEWEPYLRGKQNENASLTKKLHDAEAELNDRVYRLFDLTPGEIKLLQKEVEH
jgi:hypothetical protein